MSLNTKLQLGLEYEKYVQKIITNKYINCWLWSEVPKHVLLDLKIINNNQENCDDIGCDIICQNSDLTYLFVQCKNYSTTGNDNTISIHDLAGFYNFIAETGFNGVVYYSGKLSTQIICRKKRINYINLPFITNKQILDFLPRDYQIEAYNYIKSNNKNILSMPCGTGKTFVSFLLSLEYSNIIILTPLISTTEQIHAHYKNYYLKYDNINFMLVNCKAERNISNIKSKLLQHQKGKNVISSTYDSCDVINKLLPNLENALIIIDEFHNLSNDMLTNHKAEMNKLIANNKNILFMSATPLKTDILTNNIYELSWENAIKNKYICNYNFYYPNNDKIITKIDDMKFDKSIIDKTILINKAYFLLDAIKLTKVMKCIVYLKSIQEMNDFVKILQTINLYFELNIKTYEIDYKTSVNERNKNLIKFKNDNCCINILCNVHILDEGIDIPECDSIYLTHPNNNIISIIQRISRANRLDKNNTNKIAKIFVWSKNEIKLESITQNISKYVDCKYGVENNECVNYKKCIDNKSEYVIDNNIYIKKIENETIKFIKVNSNIPHTFIDDFFSLYTYESTFNELNINFENLVKWLNMRKDNLKKTLTTSYIKNIDYKIKKVKSKTAGKPREEIMITADCCKRLCMLSKTEKAEEVRTYFIEIEKLMNKYKDYIIEALNKKVGILDNNQKPIPDNKNGIIYILKTDKDIVDLYKIGKTQKFKERIRTHNSSHIDNVDIVHIYETKYIDEVEKCLKNVLTTRQYRKRKEFYQIDLDVLKELINNCNNMSLKVRKVNKNIKQEGGFFIMLDKND
jgi:superfamily II DNA or RNA helicase/phage anti-repressor protein